MKPYKINLLLFFVIITHGQETLKVKPNFPALLSVGSDDYYSSLIGVQSLAKQEQQVVAKLVRYKRKLESTLKLINDYLNDYNESVSSVITAHPQLRKKIGEKKYPVLKSSEDLQLYSEQVSANPLMVFKLLRRFAVELTDVQIETKDNDYHSEFKQYFGSLSSAMKFPSFTDLNGAADGLLRIQEAYQLPTKEMSNGVLVEKQTGCKLLAADMLFIGVRAVNIEQFAIGVQWLFYAYERVLNGDGSLPLDIAKGHLRMAGKLHNAKFMRFDYIPSNLFSNLLNSTCTNIPELYIPPMIWEYPLGFTTDSLYDKFNFNALCRGEQLLTPLQSKSLHCWYSKNNSAYNIISPLKVEMHHANPPVFQIYDLISDTVINRIKEASLPKLKRSKVLGTKASSIKSDVRTSSVAWLLDRNTNDTALNRIPRTVKRATGLACETKEAVEDLQVSCYGSVGGYYIPHLDALRYPNEKLTPEQRDDFKRGDRVATMMFYLSDVELGGGTAFPRLGVAAKPIKGSAVIWYNLKLNGNRDLLTLHGGCPVLYGNKWVANKWIRLHEQIHTRKCSSDMLE